MCKYRFSPSALDKWQRYLESEAYFESDYNYTDEEGYKQTLDEIVTERKQELLDYLNKVPQEPSFEAARGKALNDAVDTLVKMKQYSTVNFAKGSTVKQQADGFAFEFDGELVNELANLMQGATMQMHVQATIDTDYGDVLVHGFPDYILPNNVTDLKSTGSSYKFGKYEHYSQRYVYPYILMKNGLMEKIDWFEFLVVELKTDKATGIISGEIIHETYTDTRFEKCEVEVRWLCEGLAMFVDEYKEQITNPKIYCV